MDLVMEGVKEQGGLDANNNNKLLDRSKVRILLCDSDPKNSQEVFFLLTNCSYQVTSVKSARQVIDVLNRQADEIDIILAEVDLPFAKGFKMLKYIARNKNLTRIPIIMMSALDEVSVVVKCLRLGAADYLVKPLRTNELLNLWTHMWRRRRMLGLSEKDIFTHELSDPSDANTNSTTLLSDDTTTATAATKDDANQEISITNQPNYECIVSPGGLACKDTSENRKSDDLAPFTGKTDLKVGQSSAFLAYVRSNSSTIQQILERSHQPSHTAIQSESPDHLNMTTMVTEPNSNRCSSSREAQESTFYDQNTCMTVGSSSATMTQPDSSSNEVQQVPMYHLPMYYPGMVDHGGMNVNLNGMPQNMQIFQGGHQYNMFQYGHPHLHNTMGLSPFHYNPNLSMGLQAGHMVPQNNQMWSGMSADSGNVAGTVVPDTTKSSQTERRAAALVKFRQKRKERCFDKKIRYINRKKLAETRPRVRGQFVRQEMNEMDLNFGTNSDGEENEIEEEPTSTSREMYTVSSPE
ncbi:CCT motif -containing response regulator protein [Carex rostrata]